MSTNVSLFDFNGQQLRVMGDKQSPWFLASDSCRALDLSYHPKHGFSQHLKKLDQKDVSPISELGVTIVGRGMAHARAVSESGLYTLVMRSDKPEAKRFQEWVTGTVLPAIRKDGGYVAGEEMVATGEMNEDELVLKALTVMQSKMVEAR